MTDSPVGLLSGMSLVVGPVCFLAGMLLRLLPRLLDPEVVAPYAGDPTYFRQELVLFQEYPSLMTTGYGLAMLGAVLLIPAIAGLASLIARSNALLGVVGGALVIAGLLPRLYHHGVDVFAVQLLRAEGFDFAAETVGDVYVAISYGPLRLAAILGAARLVGWPLLALGSWRSGVTGVAGAMVLAAMGFHRQGVLKGSSILWTLIIVALCAVLVPLGVRILRRPHPPDA